MSETLRWWLAMEVVGLATLPLCLTLFSRLPDRGYALSKAFALIILGYLLWILNVMHIMPNSEAGISIILLVLFGISTLVFLRKRDDLLGFARTRWWLILAIELLLFLTFITAAYLRSYVGDLGGTEKPMDFMFLNAMTRADHFPPPDPWLAGEKVAYYYFGYLIVSIMTRVSAVQTSVGFNLGVAMIASLAIVGAFGLVYNMTAPRAQRELEGGPGAAAAGFTSRVLWRPIIFGLSAGLLLAVIGNLEGLLEALTSHGIGGSGFWSWVHIQGLVPYHSLSWYPNTDGGPPGFWFWWRATRILDGSTGIHEFPFFSFLLGDLHPHVMSIPFVLLALGVGQLLLRYEGPLDLVVWLERPLWLVGFAVIVGGLAFINTWDMPTVVFIVSLMALLRNRLVADRWSWGLVADTAGFLLPLFICALLAYSPFFFGGFSSQASGFKDEAHNGTRLFDSLLLWGAFATLVLPYAFWRLRRTSQSITMTGVLWSLAPALFILLLWASWNVLGVHEVSGKVQSGFAFDHLLGWLPKVLRPNDAVNDAGHPVSLATRIGNRGANWLTVLVMMGSLSLLGQALYHEVEAAATRHRLRNILSLPPAFQRSRKRAGSADDPSVIDAEFRELPEEEPPTQQMELQDEPSPQTWNREDHLGHIFALALSATAALLILGSEFFFILDTFNGRMNTIFKLYYQAWLMLSVAGGFVLFEIAQGWRMPSLSRLKAPTADVAAGKLPAGELVVGAATLLGAIVGVYIVAHPHGSAGAVNIVAGLIVGAGVFFVISGASLLWWRSAPSEGEKPAAGLLSWRGVWAGATAMVLFVAFLYPVLATYNRTGGFNNKRVLDGLSVLPPNQRAAIDWLRDRNGHPVVVEAVGGDYTEFGTISAATGLPTIVQWAGHELQWRGTGNGLSEREKAVETLYTSTQPDQVRSILQQYKVQYVVVGPLEREKYQSVTIEQMSDLLQPAKQEGDVTIYRVAPGILSSGVTP